jgi:hypothetical protein
MQKTILFSILIILSNIAIGQKKINQSLKKQLDNILIEDQKIRDLLSSEILQTKADSIAQYYGVEKRNLVPHLIKLIPIADSINLCNVEKIIEQYGYPGLSMVGEETNEAAFYVIQHSTKIATYLPIIKKAAEEKEIAYTLYAMMFDRALMYNNQEQIYGTQIKGYTILNTKTKKEEYKKIVWPIKNASDVNALRKKVGFIKTVEEYAQSMGVTYKPITLKEASINYQEIN